MLKRIENYLANRPDKETDLWLTIGYAAAIGYAVFVYLAFHQSVMPIK